MAPSSHFVAKSGVQRGTTLGLGKTMYLPLLPLPLLAGNVAQPASLHRFDCIGVPLDFLYIGEYNGPLIGPAIPWRRRS